MTPWIQIPHLLCPTEHLPSSWTPHLQLFCLLELRVASIVHA